jgi:hypothetical protein
MMRAIIILLICFSQLTTAGNMHEIQSADILRITRSGDGISARVTLRINKDVPLKYWVNCDYYDKESEIIASTSHVLRKRVPTFTVKADPSDIYFALCFVPS